MCKLLGVIMCTCGMVSLIISVFDPSATGAYQEGLLECILGILVYRG